MDKIVILDKEYYFINYILVKENIIIKLQQLITQPSIIEGKTLDFLNIRSTDLDKEIQRLVQYILTEITKPY